MAGLMDYLSALVRQRSVAGSGELPDYGYGAMDTASRAGAQRGVMSAGYLPTGLERAMDMATEYGPIPAKMATSVLMQPVRAGESLADAVIDPSIPNATRAGVDTALAVAKPMAALKLLGAGYGAAGASDLGVPSLIDQAFAGRQKTPTKKAAPVAKLPGLSDEEQAAYAGIMARLASGEFGSGAERRALESQAGVFQKKAGVAAERAAELEAAKAAADRAEYDKKVGAANDAFNREMSRTRRFEDTEVGKVWDKTGGLAPGLLALGTGGLLRAATGGKLDYRAAAGLGAAEGAAASNIPLGYNALFTPPDNPERRAYEAKARELPQGHPQKEELTAYANTLPVANPIREIASAELYDPKKAGERALFGSIEGVVGGLTGAKLAALPGRALEGAAALPGRMSRAYYKSQAEAEQARGGLLEAVAQNKAATPGSAAQPARARPPEVPPLPPQDPPLPPGRGTPAHRPQSYSSAQKKVARALIDSEVGVGGAVPSQNALENAYAAAGIKTPTAMKYTDLLTGTQKLVADMQAQGMSGNQIVAALRALRENKGPVLGLAGGGMLAPGMWGGQGDR